MTGMNPPENNWGFVPEPNYNGHESKTNGLYPLPEIITQTKLDISIVTTYVYNRVNLPGVHDPDHPLIIHRKQQEFDHTKRPLEQDFYLRNERMIYVYTHQHWINHIDLFSTICPEEYSGDCILFGVIVYLIEREIHRLTNYEINVIKTRIQQMPFAQLMRISTFVIYRQSVKTHEDVQIIENTQDGKVLFNFPVKTGSMDIFL